MSTSFSSVPIIDFSRLGSAETKPEALIQLRDAVFSVGFLYLVNTGLEVSKILLTHEATMPVLTFFPPFQPLLKEAHEKVSTVFEIPPELKEKCHMRNSPSFLGYTGLGTETTAAKTDIREVSIIDLFHRSAVPMIGDYPFIVQNGSKIKIAIRLRYSGYETLEGG